MTGARADRPILAAGGLVAVGFVGESDEERNGVKCNSRPRFAPPDSQDWDPGGCKHVSARVR